MCIRPTWECQLVKWWWINDKSCIAMNLETNHLPWIMTMALTFAIGNISNDGFCASLWNQMLWVCLINTPLFSQKDSHLHNLQMLKTYFVSYLFLRIISYFTTDGMIMKFWRQTRVRCVILYYHKKKRDSFCVKNLATRTPFYGNRGSSLFVDSLLVCWMILCQIFDHVR